MIVRCRLDVEELPKRGTVVIPFPMDCLSRRRFWESSKEENPRNLQLKGHRRTFQ